MSKEQPNQDYYKIAGRSQTDGPDRLDPDPTAEKHDLAQAEKEAKAAGRATHPAVMRSKRK